MWVPQCRCGQLEWEFMTSTRIVLDGKVKSCTVDDCPQVELFRKRVCQFKRGIQPLDKVELDPLQATIEHFQS